VGWCSGRGSCLRPVRVLRVDCRGRPGLVRIQEDFGELAILEAADPDDVANALVVNLEQSCPHLRHSLETEPTQMRWRAPSRRCSGSGTKGPAEYWRNRQAGVLALPKPPGAMRRQSEGLGRKSSPDSPVESPRLLRRRLRPFFR